jgi:hypothetical protein
MRRQDQVPPLLRARHELPRLRDRTLETSGLPRQSRRLRPRQRAAGSGNLKARIRRPAPGLSRRAQICAHRAGAWSWCKTVGGGERNRTSELAHRHTTLTKQRKRRLSNQVLGMQPKQARHGASVLFHFVPFGVRQAHTKHDDGKARRSVDSAISTLLDYERR